MEQISKSLFNWASILEDGARKQAEATASMPFIWPHLAVMPDAHWGRGATVGSVIPTLGAIIPAAVGVDIGCVDRDSEYLSPDGWRKIGDYHGGKVMQYDPFTGAGRLVEPSAYIVKECDEFYRLKTKYGVDQMLSADHRVLCWRITGRARCRVMTVMQAADFAAEHGRLKQGFKAEFATVFTPDLDTKVSLSDAQIRVQVMVNADSALNHGAAVLHLQKERKIGRARELLTDAGISWTEHDNSDGTFSMRFNPPIMAKSYDLFWGASAEQLAVIADECLRWDGNLDDRCFYTRDQASADFIQYAFTACGYRAVLRSDEHYRDGETDYRVFANTNTMVGMGSVPKTPITVEPSDDGRAYCFTVPSGYWVMRRGGNVVMTGNCGMMAALTELTREHLTGPDAPPLSRLRESIERAIPLSAGKYNDAIYDGRYTRSLIAHLEARDGLDSAEQVAANWRLQLGSLGSGNHFIEVSLDEQDRVWLFLHSGSRGVGNKLATRHIKIAQEQCQRRWISLPDPDLAYLVEGEQEFWDYLRDLRWAQEFARFNREEMLDRAHRCLEDFMGGSVRIEDTIQCHHNYTEQMTGGLLDYWKRPKGRSGHVWLSRKGAIDATEGKLGLIPGSMGAASYVVAGKGNKLSLCSSPHGAGRQLSRKQAEKTFTRADLDERMGGIEWGRSDAFLDEHPSAYKPIDVVMADAADLVEIRHTLRQIVNVKGD
jgi:tRNA-splicing ligase RtcB